MQQKVEVNVYMARAQDWSDSEGGYPWKWKPLVSPYEHEAGENLIPLGKQIVLVEGPDPESYDFRKDQLAAVEAALTKARAEAYKAVSELEAARNRLLALEG